MASDPVAVRQGTLDMLILKALSLQPNHGWGIGERIKQISRDLLFVNQGSLYPALHRLEGRGLLSAEWRPSDDNRSAKYYRLTAAGRKHLKNEITRWHSYSRVMTSVLVAPAP